ncbi:MAG: hypothetical protein AB9903_24215 [Vulcanimicrobiota bacterium]
MMNEIMPIGNFLGSRIQRLPSLTGLPINLTVPSIPTFGEDTIQLTSTPVKTKPKAAIEAIKGVDSIASPFDQTPTASKTTAPSVPTTIAMIDDMESSLKYWLPYDEGDSIARSVRQWADTRDEVLRHMEGVTNEKEHEIEAMQAKAGEAERVADEAAGNAEAVSTATDSKKSEEVSKQRELENLEKGSEADDTEKLEEKIKTAEKDIFTLKGDLEVIRSQVSELKAEPQKYEDKIEKLEGEALQVSEKIKGKEEEKKSLEARKKDKEHKLEEQRKEAEKKQAEKTQVEGEIKTLEDKRKNLESSIAGRGTEKDAIQREIEARQAELEKIEWIVADYRFKSQGRGL